jgi:hypothetical protein
VTVDFDNAIRSGNLRIPESVALTKAQVVPVRPTTAVPRPVRRAVATGQRTGWPLRFGYSRVLLRRSPAAGSHHVNIICAPGPRRVVVTCHHIRSGLASAAVADGCPRSSFRHRQQICCRSSRAPDEEPANFLFVGETVGPRRPHVHGAVSG